MSIHVLIEITNQKEGTQRHVQFDLKEDSRLMVGRTDCDLNLDDAKLSRRHLMLLVAEGQVIAQDLKSRNGSFIGDSRFESHVLQPGDTLTIGRHSIHFVELDGIRSDETEPGDANTSVKTQGSIPIVKQRPERTEEFTLSEVGEEPTVDETLPTGSPSVARGGSEKQGEFQFFVDRKFNFKNVMDCYRLGLSNWKGAFQNFDYQIALSESLIVIFGLALVSCVLACLVQALSGPITIYIIPIAVVSTLFFTGYILALAGLLTKLGAWLGVKVDYETNLAYLAYAMFFQVPLAIVGTYLGLLIFPFVILFIFWISRGYAQSFQANTIRLTLLVVGLVIFTTIAVFQPVSHILIKVFSS